jgi:O-antigen ligase
MPLGATSYMPKSVFGIPALNAFNIVIVATLVSYLVRERAKDLAPPALVWLYVLPILIAGVMGMPHVKDIAPILFEDDGLVFTGPGGYFAEMALRPLLMVAASMLVGAAAARSEQPERFLVPIMASVWVLALLQIGMVIASGVKLGFLASASARAFYEEMGLHANALGRLFAVAYSLMLFVWWETRRPGLKSALLVTMGVASLAMVLSFSRGAFLGFFIVNALFLLWKFNAKTFGIVLLGAAFVTLFAPEYLWDRITMGFDSGDANAVSADRIEGIWVPLLPEIWKSPIWGNGIGSTMWSLPMVAEAMLPVGHPHSAYLEAVLDMGFVGLALMLAYYLHVWRGFRALGSNPYMTPEMRAFFQGATAALIVFFVTGWVGSSFRPEPEFGLLWFAIGMMYGMFARTRRAAG